MITKIEVDGFKSLRKFSLDLKSGINILVGPNGVGKTNIIQFFEFLSQMMKTPLAKSVSTLGGAGSIFQKIGAVKYNDTITFKIYGSKKIANKRFIVYEYKSKIKASFDDDTIHFDSQRIQIRTASKFWSNPEEKLYKSKWDLDIEFINNDTNKGELNIHKLDRRKFKARFLLSDQSDTNKLYEEFKSFSLDQDLANKPIIYSILPFFDISHFLITDIIGGETFNIVPSKVKEIEDAATPPEIKRDGSGLSTTLYAMKKSKPKQQGRQRFYFGLNPPERTFEPKTLKKVISYLKLANRTIQNLDIENDPFDNKLIVKITIRTDESTAVLPLSAMSDGTIKWLALITAILTSKTIFSIEEPENFLHPWMQAEIAQIMREHINDKNSNSFVLMTTHSESLLNSSNPEEVIIVDMKDGSTFAKRIKDIQLVREEISKSGFGLGHFYFANAIQDV